MPHNGPKSVFSFFFLQSHVFWLSNQCCSCKIPHGWFITIIIMKKIGGLLVYVAWVTLVLILWAKGMRRKPSMKQVALRPGLDCCLLACLLVHRAPLLCCLTQPEPNLLNSSLNLYYLTSVQLTYISYSKAIGQLENQVKNHTRLFTHKNFPLDRKKL